MQMTQSVLYCLTQPAYPSNEKVTYMFQNIETYDENNVYT